MAIYALGDVQGCVVPLEEMLDTLRFDPARDRLWLTGDLVNRGRHSLETLRLIMRLGDSAVAVLGNHDLHLLAVAAGVREARACDTLEPILRAPDRDELIDWLRRRPLVHWDKRAELGVKSLMVHAGIHPGWRKKEVARLAAEVEGLLRGGSGDSDYHRFLKQMYGREPSRWEQPMNKWQRARFITNALTRIRYCDRRRHAALDFDHKGPPDSRPKHLVPWFAHPDRKCKNWRIVFGHWSALGFVRNGNILGLDSGCIWGGALTAVRLDGEQSQPEPFWQVKCKKC